MALPALALLQSRGVELRCFGRDWAVDLLAGLGLRVAALPHGVIAGARALRKSGARRGLLFTNSLGSAIQMRLAMIPAIGYRRGYRDALVSRTLDRAPGLHEVEAFWRLACAALTEFGATPPAGQVPFPRLPLVTQHWHQAREALGEAGVAAPYVVLCPVATGVAEGHSKVWPHFAELSRRLHSDGATVIGCPGPGESDQVTAALPGAVILSGLQLGAYAAVMEQAQLVVANDSGPLHLAAAVGAPVLGIFGSSDPTRTRPWSARGLALGGDGKWPDVEAVQAALGRLTLTSART
jgi:heptosyltransferase II